MRIDQVRGAGIPSSRARSDWSLGEPQLGLPMLTTAAGGEIPPPARYMVPKLRDWVLSSKSDCDAATRKGRVLFLRAELS